MNKIIIILSLLFFSACKKVDRYTKIQMYKIAIGYDKNIKFKLGESLADVIPCEDYGKGCIGSHRVLVSKVVLIAVEFDIEENAKIASKRIGEYYAKNWVFDDVSGEPVLVKFVEKAFQAKKIEVKKEKPKKKVGP